MRLSSSSSAGGADGMGRITLSSFSFPAGGTLVRFTRRLRRGAGGGEGDGDAGVMISWNPWRNLALWTS